MHETNDVKLVDAFYVDYKFTNQQGTVTEATLKVSREDYNRIGVGSEVPVNYHPANPAVSRLLDFAEPRGDAGPGASILVCGLLTLVGAWFVGWAWLLGRKITSTPASVEHRGLERMGRIDRASQPATNSRPAAPTRGPRQGGFGQRARA